VEIRDWLRAIGSRFALIVVVAGLAAFMAATVALFQPQQYRATATVALPDVPASGPLTAVVGQRVANFQGAVASDGVRDGVATATGVTRGALESLTSRRNGSSNVMEVSFVGVDAEQARAVAEAAVREALRISAQSDVAFAEARLDAEQTLFDESLDAWREKAEEFLTPLTAEYLSVLQGRLIRAEDAYLSAIASGDEQEQADAEAKRANISDRLFRVQEVQRLEAALSTATTGLATARGQLTRTQGQFEAAETLPVLVGEVARLSKLAAIVERGAYAGLFGAALAVGFVVILELLRSGAGGQRPSLPRPSRPRQRADAF